MGAAERDAAKRPRLRGGRRQDGKHQERVNSFKQIFVLSMFILIKLITGDQTAIEAAIRPQYASDAGG